MLRPLPPSRPMPARAEPGLSALQRAILLTVLYADLFDFAMTEDELYRRLIGAASGRRRFAQALASLAGTYLTASGGYVVWTGREALVALRRRRRQLAPARWAAARRYARWLRRVPFVRMVAVSGSLAVDNAAEQSDVDLFCVTAEGRLWVARLFLVALSRTTRMLPRAFPLYLCPNYVLAADALGLDDRNLFTAHEVVQAVPLWGAPVHDAFLRANAWTRALLPQAPRPARPAPLDAVPAPGLTRLCERLLGGRAGDRLDAWLHRLFVAAYRRRAERMGRPWAALAGAYQRSRYTVPEGGYARVVPRLFAARVAHRLGNLVPAAELDRLFPGAPPGAGCYGWDERFRQEYGASTEAAP